MHISTYIKGGDALSFHFTSEGKMNTFEKHANRETDETSEKLNKVYKGVYNINASWLDLIRLYTKIQTRNFKITVNGVDYTCPENLPLVVRFNKK